jgi:hypothetical protein
MTNTYSPLSFPRRPPQKDSTPLTELRYQVRLLHYRYEIYTGLYVMSSGEKVAFNLIMVGLLAMFVLSVHFCLPSAFKQSCYKLAHYAHGGLRGSLSAAQKAVVPGSVGEMVVRETMEAGETARGGMRNGSRTGPTIIAL